METNKPKQPGIKEFAKRFDLTPEHARGLVLELKSLGIDPYIKRDLAIDTEVVYHTREYLFGDLSQAIEKPELIKTYCALAWECTKEIYNNYQKDYQDDDFSILLDLWGEARLTAYELLERFTNSKVSSKDIQHIPSHCRSIINGTLQHHINSETPYGITGYQEMFIDVLKLPVDDETEIASSQN